jgi:hypothetical protein
MLSGMQCDGCGRKPNFWEWARAELTSYGYQDWRHPGIVFNAAGLPLKFDTQAQAAQLFYALFERPMPFELSYLCPHCQAWAESELPSLIQQLGGSSFGTRTIVDGHFFG